MSNVYVYPSDPPCSEKGIKLIDYFAAEALKGELACQDSFMGRRKIARCGELAKRCYEFANSLIIERDNWIESEIEV